MKLSELNAIQNPLEEDHRKGHYYVTVINGENVALAAGPYPTHKKALSKVKIVEQLITEVDPGAWFFSYGTCRLEPNPKNPIGKLMVKHKEELF